MIRRAESKLDWVEWSLVGLVVLVSLRVLWPDVNSASDLRVVPDSVEYAVSARRFLREGDLTIAINRDIFPPRYSFFFPIIGLSWVYLLWSAPGGGVVFVALSGLVVLYAAFQIGRQLGGIYGGLLSALFILNIWMFKTLAGEIMSDVPSAAWILVSCLAYVKLSQKSKWSGGEIFRTGLAVMLAGFRPLGVVCGLPFVRTLLKRCQLKLALLICGPALALALVTLTYNRITFGSMFRNGYNYWVAMPCDYPTLAFSPKNIPAHLSILVKQTVLPLALVILLGWFWIRQSTFRFDPLSKSATRPFLEFSAIFGLSHLIFHSLAFYPRERFYLPEILLAYVFIGSILGSLFHRSSMLSCLVVVTCAILPLTASDLPLRTGYEGRYRTVRALDKLASQNALIISGQDPVYLTELIVRDTARTILPISRRVEYASKVIVERKVPLPPGESFDWRDHRPRFLKEAGQEAVKAVALDNPEVIDDALRENKMVLIDLVSLSKDEVLQLSDNYNLLPKEAGIAELKNLKANLD